MIRLDEMWTLNLKHRDADQVAYRVGRRPVEEIDAGVWQPQKERDHVSIQLLAAGEAEIAEIDYGRFPDRRSDPAHLEGKQRGRFPRPSPCCPCEVQQRNSAACQ